MNLYEVQWKVHEDQAPVTEFVEADLLEYTGNTLIFAKLMDLPGSPDEEEDPPLNLNDLAGVDPLESMYQKERKKQKQQSQKVPQVILILPVNRVVLIRRLERTNKGAH